MPVRSHAQHHHIQRRQVSEHGVTGLRIILQRLSLIHRQPGGPLRYLRHAALDQTRIALFMFRWHPAFIHLGDGHFFPGEVGLLQAPQKALRATAA